MSRNCRRIARHMVRLRLGQLFVKEVDFLLEFMSPSLEVLLVHVRTL